MINAPYKRDLDCEILCFGPNKTYVIEDVEHHPLHVLLLGEMNSKHLLGSYFFDGPVNHFNYLAMIENWFIPQLQSLGFESNAWFQQMVRHLISQ